MPATTSRSGLSRPEPLVDPVPEGLADLCPPEVGEASRKLSEAERRRSAAREAVAGARATAEAARQEDQASAEGAARRGRKAPPAKARAAQEQVEDRVRDLEAHGNVAREAKAELLAALHAHAEEIEATCEVEVEETAAAARDHIAALERLLARRRDVESLRGAVKPEWLQGREAGFSLAKGQRRQRDPLAPEARALIEAIRASFAPREFKNPSEWNESERRAAEEARARGERLPQFQRDEYIAWQEGAA
jgi:hypothetical protein